MSPRAQPDVLFVVGTDTAVGKTEVTAALLRSLRAEGRNALAYKPAMSGQDDPDDVRRLLDATAPLPGAADDRAPPTREESCAFFFREPLAPGVAECPEFFTGAREADPETRSAAIEHAFAHFQRFLDRHRPEIVFVEGAGGLHVPMPGGTWLEEWIAAFGDRHRARCLVVARAGLGTLNHSLATFEGLRQRGLDTIGFLVSDQARPEITGDRDPSLRTNIEILEQRSGYHCLGRLPHLSSDERTRAMPSTQWLTAAGLERLARRPA